MLGVDKLGSPAQKKNVGENYGDITGVNKVMSEDSSVKR